MRNKTGVRTHLNRRRTCENCSNRNNVDVWRAIWKLIRITREICVCVRCSTEAIMLNFHWINWTTNFDYILHRAQVTKFCRILSNLYQFVISDQLVIMSLEKSILASTLCINWVGIFLCILYACVSSEKCELCVWTLYIIWQPRV